MTGLVILLILYVKNQGFSFFLGNRKFCIQFTLIGLLLFIHVQNCKIIQWSLRVALNNNLTLYLLYKEISRLKEMSLINYLFFLLLFCFRNVHIPQDKG